MPNGMFLKSVGIISHIHPAGSPQKVTGEKQNWKVTRRTFYPIQSGLIKFFTAS